MKQPDGKRLQTASRRELLQGSTSLHPPPGRAAQELLLIPTPPSACPVGGKTRYFWPDRSWNSTWETGAEGFVLLRAANLPEVPRGVFTGETPGRTEGSRCQSTIWGCECACFHPAPLLPSPQPPPRDPAPQLPASGDQTPAPPRSCRELSPAPKASYPIPMGAKSRVAPAGPLPMAQPSITPGQDRGSWIEPSRVRGERCGNPSARPRLRLHLGPFLLMSRHGAPLPPSPGGNPFPGSSSLASPLPAGAEPAAPATPHTDAPAGKRSALHPRGLGAEHGSGEQPPAGKTGLGNSILGLKLREFWHKGWKVCVCRDTRRCLRRG